METRREEDDRRDRMQLRPADWQDNDIVCGYERRYDIIIYNC